MFQSSRVIFTTRSFTFLTMDTKFKLFSYFSNFMTIRRLQALDYPAQRGELLRQLFTDVALEVDKRALGKKKLPF